MNYLKCETNENNDRKVRDCLSFNLVFNRRVKIFGDGIMQNPEKFENSL